MNSEARTESLLDAAVKLAQKVGWDNLTRDGIATAAGVSFALVTLRLGQKNELMRNVMRRAVHVGCVPVVAQGLVRNDKVACNAPEALKARVRDWMATR